jgi:hypothetical protein
MSRMTCAHDPYEDVCDRCHRCLGCNAHAPECLDRVVWRCSDCGQDWSVSPVLAAQLEGDGLACCPECAEEEYAESFDQPIGDDMDHAQAASDGNLEVPDR